jgi:hypothetical protein
LNNAATAGDTITTISFYVSSVLNAIPATAASINQSYLASGVAGTGPAFSAYLTTTQTVNSSTATKYAAGTKRFDTNNCYDATNYRFTPNVAGYYLICVANWYANGTGAYPTSLYKNGTEYARYYTYESSGNTLLCQALIYFNGSTDYVEAYFTQSTGSSQTLDANALNPGFYGHMVRAA